MGGQRGSEGVIAALHDAARASTGLDAFGDGYLDGLTRVVDELLATGTDPESPRFAALTDRLVGRLRSEESWRIRPDVLDDPVPPPIVITGLPRTGTTALHKLLSVDDRFQVLESWIQHCPMPRPPRDQWQGLPCYEAAATRFAQRPEANRRAHSVAPDEADECLLVMAQTFASNFFGEVFFLPEYDAWFLDADMIPSFERYADQLRLIGTGDPRRWLLKNPSHLFSLEELFAVFPDAFVIQTHRNVVEAMSSQLSLLSIVAGADPHQRVDRELRMWGDAVHRADAARVGREHRFCDVGERDIADAPLEVVEAIYRGAGLELDDRVRGRMQRWVDENPRHKYGVHRHDPAAMGITRAAVEEHFGDYATIHGAA